VRGAQDNPTGAGLGILFGAFALIAGCASGEPAIHAIGDRADGGSSSGFDGGGDHSPPANTTRIREDFDNHNFVDQQSNVIIDYNKGLVTLSTPVFPEIDDTHLQTYQNAIDVNGTVQASDIVVDGKAMLNASDSIELLAQHLLNVTGEIHAGAGGVTLAAGDQVIIDGRIDSEGPIKILLGSNTGTVAIAGTVNAISAMTTSDLKIIARGQVNITGQVMASADMGLASGDVLISAYGKVTVTGVGAAVVTSAQAQGTTGALRIQSETNVEISNGAFVGGVNTALNQGPPPYPPLVPPMQQDPSVALLGAGDIQIQARVVTISETAQVVGASTLKGTASSVLITAGDELDIIHHARILSGSGDTTGAIKIASTLTTISDASLLESGTGASAVQAIEIDSASLMTIGRDSSITGGDGTCASGGDITVHVGDALSMDPGATIHGGSGGTLVAMLGCPTALHRGGNIDVIARGAMGVQGALVAGSGASPGTIDVMLEPDYQLASPMLEPDTVGWVESRPVDRGDVSMGLSPILVSSRLTIPRGTSVAIQLGGAETPDGPYDFVDLSSIGMPADALKSDRYFKYHVALGGRAFDTPIVDFFDIDLAPRSAR
jgi:hypothetical protein